MNLIGLIAICIILFIAYKYYNIKKKAVRTISEEAFGLDLSDTIKEVAHTPIREFCIRTYNLERYNSQTYQDFLDLIDEFLSIYELNLISSSVSTKTYALLIDRRELIMNTFMSFQLLIPTEYNLAKATRDLESILNVYIDTVSDINAEYINKHGYNTNTLLLKSNALAVNRFTEDVGSFSQY